MSGRTHTSEDLRNYNTYAIVGESASMFWVGDAPRLSTDDDAESYVQIGPNVSTGIATVTFAPFTVTGDIALRARVRVFGGDFGASTLFLSDEAGQTAVDFLFEDHVIDTGSWVTIESTFTQAQLSGGLDASAAAGTLTAGIFPGYVLDETYYWVSLLSIQAETVEGILAIDTHDHPFHFIGTRDPAMPYELVIDTGTQRLVEIVAGEEALATHELVIDETGRPGDPWSHCGLFRPL